MPEGCEILHEANYMREKLKLFFGDSEPIITAISWDSESRYHYREEMEGLDLCVLPIRICKIFSRGKIIIWECINAKNKKIYIVNHLGMTGKWIFSDFKDGLGTEKHSNLWVTFGKESESYRGTYQNLCVLYFNDYRKMGYFEVTESLAPYFKKNGPCLMTEALIKKGDLTREKAHTEGATFKVWTKCINNKRLKKKNIGEFFMEQKYVSGIGNYLRAEILYMCKISPFRKLIDLTEAEKKKLYDVSIDKIYESYIKQGPKDGYIKSGSLYLYCYGRSEDDYGNPIYNESDAKNRTIHYCPAVQK